MPCYITQEQAEKRQDAWSARRAEERAEYKKEIQPVQGLLEDMCDIHKVAFTGQEEIGRGGWRGWMNLPIENGTIGSVGLHNFYHGYSDVSYFHYKPEEDSNNDKYQGHPSLTRKFRKKFLQEFIADCQERIHQELKWKMIEEEERRLDIYGTHRCTRRLIWDINNPGYMEKNIHVDPKSYTFTEEATKMLLHALTDWDKLTKLLKKFDISFYSLDSYSERIKQYRERNKAKEQKAPKKAPVVLTTEEQEVLELKLPPLDTFPHEHFAGLYKSITENDNPPDPQVPEFLRTKTGEEQAEKMFLAGFEDGRAECDKDAPNDPEIRYNITYQDRSENHFKTKHLPKLKTNNVGENLLKSMFMTGFHKGFDCQSVLVYQNRLKKKLKG